MQLYKIYTNLKYCLGTEPKSMIHNNEGYSNGYTIRWQKRDHFLAYINGRGL